ncbi:hypothetical protein D3C72_2008580 [compost metagenome]
MSFWKTVRPPMRVALPCTGLMAFGEAPRLLRHSVIQTGRNGLGNRSRDLAMPDRAMGRLAANGPALSVTRNPPPRMDTPARNST